MKNVFLLLMICVSSLCATDSWVDYYAKAAETVKTDPVKGLEYYDKAIESLKDPNAKETLFLFQERGNCHLVLGHQAKALVDFEHVINALLPPGVCLFEAEGKIPAKYLNLFCDALSTKLITYCELNDFDHLEEAKLLRSMDPRVPVFYELEDGRVVMTGVKTEGDSLEQTQKLMMQQDVIENPEDVQLTPSGAIFRPKKNPTCDSCCDSCADGGECEDEMEKKKLFPPSDSSPNSEKASGTLQTSKIDPTT